jgi:hypothetical protein
MGSDEAREPWTEGVSSGIEADSEGLARSGVEGATGISSMSSAASSSSRVLAGWIEDGTGLPERLTVSSAVRKESSGSLTS